jgi:prolyl oligopeptidase
MRSNRLCPLALLALTLPALAAPPAPPVAPVEPVTDDYFGTKVSDNYRYFENEKDPRLQSWMKAQAQYARTVLDSLPGRKTLLERITALDKSQVVVFDTRQRGTRYFYQKRTPADQVAKLYYRDGLGGAEHLLLDPAKLGTAQAHAALDYFEPSWDGRLIAYGVSLGGSEESVLHVLEVSGGRKFAEAIDRTMLSVVAWLPDNRGFFYLRYPKPTPDMKATDTEYNARTYRHTLGSDPSGEGDALVFGRGVAAGLDVPEGQGTYVLVSPDSPYAIAVANRNMDNAPATLYVAPLASVTGPATPWRKLADVADGLTQYQAQGEYLYYLTLKGASRYRLARVPLAHADLAQASPVLPEGQVVLTAFALARDAVYVSARDGATSKVLRVAADGSSHNDVPLLFPGTATLAATDPKVSGVLIDLDGWIDAERIFHYDPAQNRMSDSGLVPAPPIDTSQLTADEVLVTSHDGTRVPLSIVRQKNAPRDGRRPTLLIGYGAYGISYDPYFSPFFVAWIERGGVIGIAHVRGGGEYGEDWHKGGQKQTKLNTVFDFVACAEYLVAEHYTAPKYLAGQGGSAGGILVGGALVWRPDLFAAIIDLVGMTDTLRFELTPNGPPNVPEIGSVTTEEGFHGLYAMSPYAHVRDGTAYPAVLLHTGANDPRVSPWIIAKMAARLQAASSSGKPILLDVDADAGHGMGSQRDQARRLWADQFAFSLWQFGDPDFQPR